MTDILPFIETRGHRRAFNRIVEVSTAEVDSTSDTTIIYGPSGSGKTELMGRVCRDLSWQGPPEYYIALLGYGRGRGHDCENGAGEYDRVGALDFAEEIGMFDHRDHDGFREALLGRFEMTRSKFVSGGMLAEWLIWAAWRSGRRAPSPIGLLPLRGIAEKVRGRYPIAVKARVKEPPASLQIQLIRALGMEDRWGWSHSRSFRLFDALHVFPILLLVDEADTLEPDSLHSIRQLCDQMRVPLVLLGTKRLESRLLLDARLRPLATRVGMRIELGRVTLAELQSAIPDVPQKSVLAIWKSSAGEFRTICLILKVLQRIRQDNPGRRVNQKVVGIAIAQVLAARPVDLRDEEEDEAAEGAGTSITSMASAREATGEIVARKTMRAAG